ETPHFHDRLLVDQNRVARYLELEGVSDLTAFDRRFRKLRFGDRSEGGHAGGITFQKKDEEDGEDIRHRGDLQGHVVAEFLFFAESRAHGFLRSRTGPLSAESSSDLRRHAPRLCTPRWHRPGGSPP